VGGLKFGFFAYRDWALSIYSFLESEYDIDLFLPKSNLPNPDDYRAFFYVGWSWKVAPTILERTECVCLHPSPLPKYRGGSPLQHQIINGEKESAVALFKMTNDMDAGPIYSQRPFALDGTMKDILERITFLGLDMIGDLLNEFEKGNPKTTPQIGTPTVYKRRTPEESEITTEKIKNLSSESIYNFIRALGDPYPNAFIRGTDGKKVLIKSAVLEK
jgi:methionyl-tRNA formyltransferase